MHESILVTGATGIIGSEVVKEFLKRNVCTRIGVRDLKKASELDTGGCPVVVLDYRKPETFRGALDGVTSLFIATPVAHQRLDDLLLPLVETARKMGVEHVVCLGSIGVDMADSPLLVIERCIENCGIPFTILRPNLLMQNFSTLAGETIRRNAAIHVPAGNGRISFVDARDVAAAAAEAILDRRHRNKLYVLTGGQSIDHYEIAYILSKVTGRTITYVPVSHNVARDELRIAGWNDADAELMIGLYEIARQGWCSQVRPDLHEVLGRDPIDFETFAEDYRDSWL